MKVLILAGQFNTISPLSKYPFTKKQILIDWQIERLESFSSEIAVIFDNNTADEILRISKKIKDTELIFDTNALNANFFTNLTAGLYSVNNFCMALPLSTPFNDQNLINKFLKHYYKYALKKKIDIIQAYFPKKNQMKRSFPLLITSQGKKSLLNEKDLNKESFEKLKFSPLSILKEPHKQILHCSFDDSPKASIKKVKNKELIRR